MPQISIKLWQRYLLALTVVSVALALTSLGWGVLQHTPLALLIAAVVIVAAYAGLGPSLFATALVVFGYDRLLALHSTALQGASDWVNLILISGVGLLISSLNHQKQAAQERALEYAQTNEKHLALLDAFFQSSPVPMAFWDRQLRYSRVNNLAAAMKGLSPEAHIGKTLREVMPDLAVVVEPLLRGVLETGEPVLNYPMYGQWLSPSDTEQRWEVSWYPVRTASGALYGVGGVLTDLTERVRMLEDLQRREAQLRLALEAGRMGAWEYDLHSGALRWSRELEEIVGLIPGTFAGTWQAFHALIHPEDRYRFRKAVVGAMRQNQDFRAEVRMMGSDGVWRWVAARGQVLRDESGAAVGMIGLGMDVTDAKRMEETLIRQADSLMEADRRKDQFLAMLGHELRNPLNALTNALYLLERSDTQPATLERVLPLMDRQVKQMTRLVEDLLDVSRIARDKVILQLAPLDLARLAQNVVEDHRASIQKAGLHLDLRIPEAPVHVTGDTLRLTQAIANLLQNAVKFTDEGGVITVEVRAAPEKGFAELSITDTGIGIEPELLPRIFDTFGQLDHSRNRSLGGLGLGLALVKGLVGLQRGEVFAHSDGAACGSRFTIRLPAGKENPL